MCLVPFEVRFSGATNDKHLDEKLTAELPGILAWAVRVDREWRERGLEPPPAVRAATEAYRADSDPLAAFMAERCLAEEGSGARAADAFDAYRAWTDAQSLPGAERLPRNLFYQLLEGHFPKRHTKKAISTSACESSIPRRPPSVQRRRGEGGEGRYRFSP